MSEECKIVECGFDMGNGQTCKAMIKDHPMARRAHMKKEHNAEGVEVKESAAATGPTLAPSERQNPVLMEGNLRAMKIQQEQLERLRADAPDVQFGGTGELSELDQRTDLARRKGLITKDDHPFWAIRGTEEQMISEGREIVMDHGQAFGLHEMVLTKRPKVIADRLDADRVGRVRKGHREAVKTAVEKGLESAKAITPDLVRPVG